MDIHFRPKNENESHLIIFMFFCFFFIHSVTKSALQCVAILPRPVSPFLQVVLDGIPLSSCTVLWHFLDDLSAREQFAFLVYCYRVKAIFHNLCTVLYWRLCGQAPIVKYPPNWGWCAWSAEGSLKQWLPNGKLLLLSHKMPWCALLTAVKNYNSLEKLQDFFSNTKMFKTKTSWSKTKTFIFVLEAPQGLEDYITGIG